ncbi:hypothetical protein IWQ60_002182 [Tieghemiomyces parasiticus]|uniref:Peroxisomal-coenzyme A synthetase n=1 Tax=Tieghemiomyces parasiticus TaxID=78921 RepID=A0A9W8DVW9_9FUNG|nr:hypothetical protein IWQ60_002182 [Tieghemiomyces parasiticus]
MAPTLADIFVHASPNADALVIPEPPSADPSSIATVLTYGDLKCALLGFQTQLAAQGLQPGDVISSIFTNTFECVVAFLGTTLMRCVAAPLNPQLAQSELEFYLDDAQTKILLVPQGTPDDHPALKAAQAHGKCRVWEVYQNRTAPGGIAVVPHGGHGTPAAAVATDPLPTEFVHQPEPEDIALLLHTSGTTGRPKAVPLTHANLTRSMYNIIGTYKLGPADRTYLVMPLFHVHGLVAGLLATLASSGRAVVPPKFSASRFWADVVAQGCTWYTAVPTIHQILLRHPSPATGQHRLRFIRSCSSALAPVIHQQLEDTYGVPVLEAYAMTEAAHQMTSNPLPPQPRKAGTVGLGFGVDVGIFDESGRQLDTGLEGEICVRGPNVTHGYLNNPTANAVSFHDGGWFRTGDQGRQDTDGYLAVTGRIKELINRGGEKISPVEVDDILLRHPQVTDAVTFGVPDEIYGQEVHAAVIPKADAHGQVTEASVKDFCRQSLAAFKVPKKVYIVDDFPRTATGKVQRRVVAQHFLNISA